MSGDALAECRDNLQEVMGASIHQWMTELRTYDLSRNVLVAHAGADPDVAPSEQSDTVLVWGHPSFQSTDRRDDVWVVHGHTIVPCGRSATGAYCH
ncbi:hypothetical protein [Ruegeria profundi]|uniref:hypothetical protein n=1 Tax=Ruegeria profundi TaxID=1685378 RepID=UPI0012FD59D2|nr:hypothetical protein [Ruegeria profundi]